MPEVASLGELGVRLLKFCPATLLFTRTCLPKITTLWELQPRYSITVRARHKGSHSQPNTMGSFRRKGGLCWYVTVCLLGSFHFDDLSLHLQNAGQSNQNIIRPVNVLEERRDEREGTGLDGSALGKEPDCMETLHGSRFPWKFCFCVGGLKSSTHQ